MRLTRNFVGIFGAMVMVSGGLAANACSSSTTNPASPAEAGSPGDSGKPDTRVGPGPDDAGTDAPVADPCSKLNRNACLTCCDNAHQAGVKVVNDAFDKCICGPPVGVDGKCQTQCAASDCDPSPDSGGSDAGDPCDLCETKETDDGGACGPKIDTACAASPDCVAWNKCGDSCP